MEYLLKNRENSLLLILPVFLKRYENQLLLDNQACNGLRLWLANFDKVTMAAVLNPHLQEMEGYEDIETIGNQQCLDVVPLPFSYTPKTFAKDYSKTIRQIDSLIDEHRYLSFAIGGFWGDWGSFACLRASRKKRKFSVWTDRVESNVILHRYREEKGIKRFYYRLLAQFSQSLNNRVIKKANLGLFHGSDCYETYSPLLMNSYCVHDIHLSSEYHITAEELERKIASIDLDRPVKIVYAGRVDAMKGPEDWVRVMKNLVRKGISLEAKWAGEGELKNKLIGKLDAEGLKDNVDFIGMVSNRDELLNLIQESDFFVFCHKTQESPRCLIEALMSGCPIVGYESPYPVDLVFEHGGGLFVEKDNVEELTKCLENLINDRTLRKKLVRDAAESGKMYSDTEVFKHRSDLIKKYL